MSKELIRLSDCFARSFRVRQNHDASYHRRLSEAYLRRRVF